MLCTCHWRSQNLKVRTPKNTDLAFWKTENWGLKSIVNILVRIRTTPQEDNSPPYRFWSWWVVLFHGSGPSGELSWWGIVLGIVVLVGNGWALFLSGGELSSWGVVLEPFWSHPVMSLPTTYHEVCNQGVLIPIWRYPAVNSLSLDWKKHDSEPKMTKLVTVPNWECYLSLQCLVVKASKLLLIYTAFLCTDCLRTLYLIIHRFISKYYIFWWQTTWRLRCECCFVKRKIMYLY